RRAGQRWRKIQHANSKLPGGRCRWCQRLDASRESRRLPGAGKPAECERIRLIGLEREAGIQYHDLGVLHEGVALEDLDMARARFDALRIHERRPEIGIRESGIGWNVHDA